MRGSRITFNIIFSRLLLKPELVGGLIDGTSGTLTSPDVDLNIEWELNEELTRLLVIRPTDRGQSGQYTLQVLEGSEEKFRSLFNPVVIDIQNHGRKDKRTYVHDNVSDAYVGKTSKTFLCSDLLRSQVGGLFEILDEEGPFNVFKKKDFSHTGAARTLALDMKQFIRSFLLNSLEEIPEEYKQIFER